MKQKKVMNFKLYIKSSIKHKHITAFLFNENKNSAIYNCILRD